MTRLKNIIWFDWLLSVATGVVTPVWDSPKTR